MTGSLGITTVVDIARPRDVVAAYAGDPDHGDLAALKALLERQ